MAVLKTLLSKHSINESVLLFSVSQQKKLDKNEPFDVFISYSHGDLSYAKALANLLKSLGYTVYMDLFDSANEGVTTGKTALHIAKVLESCESMVYLHSKSAKLSKWCPWEMGYISGVSSFSCAILPVKEKLDDYCPRQEYLELYPELQITESQEGKISLEVIDRAATKRMSFREFIRQGGEELVSV